MSICSAVFRFSLLYINSVGFGTLRIPLNVERGVSTVLLILTPSRISNRAGLAALVLLLFTSSGSSLAPLSSASSSSFSFPVPALLDSPSSIVSIWAWLPTSSTNLNFGLVTIKMNEMNIKKSNKIWFKELNWKKKLNMEEQTFLIKFVREKYSSLIHQLDFNLHVRADNFSFYKMYLILLKIF